MAEAIDRRTAPPVGARRLGYAWVLIVVSNLYGVELEDLRASTRKGARAAFARQLAMYLLHVVYGLSLTEAAEAFGRDRSTASHACRVIEDLREDAVFDRQLARLENLLREAERFEVAA